VSQVRTVASTPGEKKLASSAVRGHGKTIECPPMRALTTPLTPHGPQFAVPGVTVA
jgi:hypothetical protein